MSKKRIYLKFCIEPHFRIFLYLSICVESALTSMTTLRTEFVTTFTKLIDIKFDGDGENYVEWEYLVEVSL